MNVADAIEKVGNWDEAVSLACEIIEFESEWCYYLGELALRVRGAPRLGELSTEKQQQVTLKTFAAEIGQEYETLKDSYRVAKYCPRDPVRKDFPTLSYGHWREIVKAGIREEPAVRKWAEEVVANQWSVTGLRNHLKGKPDPESADGWRALTKKAYRVLEEMENFNLRFAWSRFPDEAGLMVKSLSSCLKTLEQAWEQLSAEERERQAAEAAGG